MREPTKCPKCKSKHIHYHKDGQYDGEEVWMCDNCHHKWDVLPW